MGITKRLNWQNIFLFLFFIIFPFGQIIRLTFLFRGMNITVLPVDVIVGCAAAFALIKKFKKIEVFKYLTVFLWAAAFSFVFSIFIFKSFSLLVGLFYLLRLAAYFYFLLYVRNFARRSAEKKKLLLNSLLAISIFSAVFGWIQYFMVPDIKLFVVWGWDMHLFRLVGTFLDPTFLGLIIVLGSMLSLYRWTINGSWKNVLITLFLLVSLAFTYSRASYLAFIGGVLAIIYLEKKFKKLVFLIAGLVIVALLLPTSRNHSIELFRSFSAIARVENYRTTLLIFSKSPIFGVGYDNMCIAYQKYIGTFYTDSHSCSGSDSSLLLVLATTGVVGFMVFLNTFKRMVGNLKNSPYRVVLGSCFVALLVHSLFSNSLFYPWIMGYFVILLAAGAKD
jgi:O-antigen ligase